MNLKGMLFENQFIQSCLIADEQENSAGRISQIAQRKLNWDYIGEKSQKEGVSLLLYRSLNHLELIGLVPGHVLESWKHSYYFNSARNILVFAEVSKLLEKFNQEKIKVIILKGLFFAEHIYKDVSLRPMADVDILIDKKELARANSVLISSGYIQPSDYADALSQSLAFSSINSLFYDKNHVSNLYIHLHWHLINSSWPLGSLVSRLDMQRIWSTAVSIRINGINSLTLSNEHQLIYLAFHSFNHIFDKMILLSDILEFLRSYRKRIDWQAAREEAERFNLSGILYYYFLFLSKLFDYGIPELKGFKPVKNCFLERIALFLIERGYLRYVSVYLIYLCLQKGLKEKLGFIRKTFFPPACVMAHSLNLPVARIKLRHYYSRIIKNLAMIFSKGVTNNA